LVFIWADDGGGGPKILLTSEVIVAALWKKGLIIEILE
jgi:hypothetical protein